MKTVNFQIAGKLGVGRSVFISGRGLIAYALKLAVRCEKINACLSNRCA